MSRKQRLYTLLSSLPYLPHFQKAKKLPVSRVVLEKRALMLPEKERELSRQILINLEGCYFPTEESSGLIAKNYDMLLQRTQPYKNLHHTLRVFLERRIVAAIYRVGHFEVESKERPKEWWNLLGKWGVHPAVLKEKRGMENRYLWLKDLKASIQDETPFEFTLLLTKMEWRDAERLAFSAPFSYEAFASYLIRWMILQMWLGFDTQKASNRFTTFTSEIVSEYRHKHTLFE